MKIPFTNFDLKLRKTDSNLVEVNEDVFKALVDTDVKYKGKFDGDRPLLDPRQSVGDDQILIPMVPMPMDIIYDVANFSDVLRTIHQNLRKEIFRLGYEIKENFSSKCIDCGKEFKSSTEQCDECNGSNLRDPDVEQKKLLVKYAKSVNDNQQDITNVSEELNDDLETIDDAYLLCTKDYYWDNEGKLLGAIPVEFLRMDPRWVRLIADKTGRPGRNQNGDYIMMCLEHRNEIHPNATACPNCGRETFPAYYRSEEPEGAYIYYTKNEICHKSKYNPSLTYGLSVIYAVWPKVVTLMNMDMYMKAYYTKQRPPKGMLFVNTPNMDSLEKAWVWATDQWKKNPHQIPPIAIEQSAGAKGNHVTFVDLMKTLDEMQYTETRNEMRRQIGAIYGVMPIFQADLSTSGGLNNEGLQITVTNRAVRDGQGLYNEGYYPWFADQLGVTDYHIELYPNEEQDRMANEELKGKQIDNAMKMQNMGYDVTLNEDEEFEFDPIDEPVEKPLPMFGEPGQGQAPSKEPGKDQDFDGEPR